MTEAEWMVCGDLEPMILFIRDRVGERKLRLFGTACCRMIWEHLTDRRSRRAVEVAERLADELATHEEVQNVKKLSILRGKQGIEFAATLTLTGKPYGAGMRIAKCIAGQENGQCHLLRDIFGNPFRPVAVDAAWLTSDVVALARGIYDERAFDRDADPGRRATGRRLRQRRHPQPLPRRKAQPRPRLLGRRSRAGEVGQHSPGQRPGYGTPTQ